MHFTRDWSSMAQRTCTNDFAGLGSNEDFGGALSANNADITIADPSSLQLRYDGAGITPWYHAPAH